MNVSRNSSFLIIILCLAVASSCFSPFRGDGGNLVIQLGAGAGRALTQPDIEQLLHTFTVSGAFAEAGAEQTMSGVKYGETVRFTVAPGLWDISVDAYLNDELVLSGSSSGVEVKSDASTSVTIELRLGGPDIGDPPVPPEEPTRDPGLYRVTENGGYTLVEEVADYFTAGDFAHVFEYLNTFSDTYTLVLGQNYSVPSNTMALKTGTLTIMSNDQSETGMRVLTVNEQGWLVQVGGDPDDDGNLVLEKNVSLKGLAGPNAANMNNDSLVKILDNGLLTMKDGSVISNNINNRSTSSAGGGVSIAQGGELWMDGGEISGNQAKGNTISSTYYASSYGGGVYINGGTFTMMSGSITNNKATGSDGNDFSQFTNCGGGVYIGNNGVFLMQDGDISGNSATAYRGETGQGNVYFGSGGGVYLQSGSFTMKGGKIYRNRSVKGGGVCIAGGSFTKENGTIYGVDGTVDPDTSNIADSNKNNPDDNIASTQRNGHAAYLSTGVKYRDTTAGTGDDGDISSDSANLVGWEN